MNQNFMYWTSGFILFATPTRKSSDIYIRFGLVIQRYHSFKWEVKWGLIIQLTQACYQRETVS